MIHKTIRNKIHICLLVLILFITAMPVMNYAAEKQSEKTRLTIAMDTSWVPFCYLDSKSGEAQGIIRNILDEAAANAGFDITYVTYDSYTEALTSVQNGETDMASGIAANHTLAKEKNVKLSDPYITISYCAVTKNKILDLYTQGSNYKVAVCKGSYSTQAMMEQMPTYQFTEYVSNTECIDAVEDGEVDMALIASYASEFYLNRSAYKDLVSVLINEYSWELCFAFNTQTEDGIIEQLNRGLSEMTAAETNEAIYSGLITANESAYGVRDFYYDNPLMIMGIVAFILIIVIFIITVEFFRKQRTEARLAEVRTEAAVAREREQLRLTFFTRMSHDMRTPLNAIMGFTGLCRDATAAEREDYLDKVDESSQLLLGLINDTLDISKIETGKLKLAKMGIYSHDLIKKIRDISEPAAKRKGVALTFQSLADKNHYIECDVMRTQQIYLNIINNAIKFTPNGGKVEVIIDCSNEDADTVFSKTIIRDTGVGMSKEFLPKLFESFSQENPQKNDNMTGTGLGMTITKSLLDLMGGRIEAESELGKGTTFTIYLDFAKLKEEPQKNPERNSHIAKQHAQLQGKRVLLCEDHPLNTELARRLLENQKMLVEHAADGQLGVEMFRQSELHYYDIILMDIRMPNMDGLEAARAIRGLDREDAKIIPILAMTANAYEEDKQEALRAGMNEHLAKPINPAELFEAMERYL